MSDPGFGKRFDIDDIQNAKSVGENSLADFVVISTEGR